MSKPKKKRLVPVTARNASDPVPPVPAAWARDKALHRVPSPRKLPMTTSMLLNKAGPIAI